MDDAVAVPLAPRIAKDIGPFLPATSEDTLTLVLETLAAVVEIDEGKWITVDLARALGMTTPAGAERDGWTPWVAGTWRKWIKGTVAGYRDYAGREAKVRPARSPARPRW